MKKKILFAVVLVMSMTAASAQTTNTPSTNTPPTNTVTNNGDLNYTKTSIFVQYGYAPITSFNGWTKNTFNMYGDKTPDVNSLSSWGAITVGATIRFNKLLELSIPLTYSHNNGEFEATGAAETTTSFTDEYYSLTPNLKINWYNSTSGKVSLYSRVGIGIAYASRKHTGNQGCHIDGKPLFAFVAAPIGIEVGKNIAFFAEAGVGQMGCISAGVRFRFRKTKQGYNDDGSIKHHNWYDRYMDKQ